MEEMKYHYQYPHPSVTTDCVIFGFDGTRLNVLLIERGIEPYRGRWAFPGGFLKMDETALMGAKRELYEETGLKGEPMSTGGGTYAKVLKQGVAFGALFPDEEDLAHQADEYETIDRLMLAMKIYANALVRLACE